MAQGVIRTSVVFKYHVQMTGWSISPVPPNIPLEPTHLSRKTLAIM